MKKLGYIFIFLISFIATFILTFPAKTVAAYFLSENKINYSKIEGNIFNLKIYDLEVNNIYLPVVLIQNSFVKVIASLNPENYLDVDFVKRKAKLKLTDLKLEKYQKNPLAYGIVSTSTKFMKKSNFIVTKGNGKLLLKRMSMFRLGNIEVSWNTQPEDNYSVVKAFIKGKNINGTFNGKLILPLGDEKNIRLKGRFRGKFYGQNVEQEININPLTLKGF